jgi:hypothetical protein
MKANNYLFTKHFQDFKYKISSNKNFTFARYADGERMILNNVSILNGTQACDIDNWKYNNNVLFSNDLLETCKHTEDNYYYAISCTCCDPEGNKFYKNLLKTNNLTFSNLFINGNYNLFINFVNSLQRNVCLIANKNCLSSEYPFDVKLKVPIPDDCVNWYENNKEKILDKIKDVSNSYNNELFFISAGPLSEIIIHNLYINNPNNTYIDVGSSLDFYTHKKITRPYQIINSEYNLKECYL